MNSEYTLSKNQQRLKELQGKRKTVDRNQWVRAIRLDLLRSGLMEKKPRLDEFFFIEFNLNG